MTPQAKRRLVSLSRHIDYLSLAAHRAILDATRLRHPYRVALNEEAAYVYAKAAAHQAALVLQIWESEK